VTIEVERRSYATLLHAIRSDDEEHGVNKGPVYGLSPEPLTFYWRGRILHLHSDDPLNLYSAPVGILRRAMGRCEGVTSLDLALRAELGAAYVVKVTDKGDGVVVDLRRAGAHPPTA
jgi:hypothetical protein